MGRIKFDRQTLLLPGFLLLLVFSSCQGGYVSSTSTDAEAAEKVVNKAKKYLGTEYQYGGESESGMDCSGLVCTSFKEAGYKLPRTVKKQSKVGKKVRRENLQPGDLVFFNTLKNKSKLNHVGLVTRVEQPEKIMFIHASSSAGVIINNLNMSYYKKNFVKAVRPF